MSDPNDLPGCTEGCITTVVGLVAFGLFALWSPATFVIAVVAAPALFSWRWGR